MSGVPNPRASGRDCGAGARNRIARSIAIAGLGGVAALAVVAVRNDAAMAADVLVAESVSAPEPVIGRITDDGTARASAA